MRLLIVFGVLFLSAVISVSSSPAIENNDNLVQKLNRNQFEEGFVRKLNTKCSQRDNNSCVMLKLIVYMNRMFKKSTIDFGDSVQITKTREVDMTSDIDDDLMLARSSVSDDETVGILLADKLWKFIRSRSLRYKMLDNADLMVSTENQGKINIGVTIDPKQTLQEMGRKRGNKHMGAMVAAVATKIGVIGALFLKGLVLMVGKALIVSKIALILSVILGLKRLLSKKHVTYEVVSHPHHVEHVAPSHDSYSTGWGRAFNGFLENIQLPDAQELAYSGQISQ